MSRAVHRVRLDIAYDGTDFSGWAKQPRRRTVEGELERALSTIAQTPVRTVVAGRTDAGVHASGQVAHVDLPVDIPVNERLARRISTLTAPDGDCVVTAATVAPEGFDARFSALFRRYEYRIVNEVIDPLTRRIATYVPRRIELQHLQAAASLFVGLHDFAAFCKPRVRATTIRSLQDFTWSQTGHLFTARLQADAFCHSMVRSLVGASLAVAEGKINLAQAEALLTMPARSGLFRALPAVGLTLMEVGYPEDALLAEQAQLTRARRELPGDDDPAGE
ncbi:tRNA pseudouridine(38-40) synthase TruA [Humidisolicoccus flavus]|uniref:tRNA pseudouridine(38-40) synthase TruA n=1 Tax=Humidisolicoccus flavus TaxID=3111414 RepID=UPI0032556065